MKRSAAFVAAAMLGAALSASADAGDVIIYDGGTLGGWGAASWWPGYAGMGWAYGWNHPWWGYPYYALGYGYSYQHPGQYPGYPYGYAAPAQAAVVEPVVTARSAASALGSSCTTAVRSCTLYRAAPLGIGCSCRVRGGRAQGAVTP